MKYRFYQAEDANGGIVDVLISTAECESDGFDPSDWFKPYCSDPELKGELELIGDNATLNSLPQVLEANN